MALLLVRRNQADDDGGTFLSLVRRVLRVSPTLSGSSFTGRWRMKGGTGRTGGRKQVGVKTEEKERGQGSTGAIRGGGGRGLHIDMQSERSMDGFLRPSVF